MGNFDTKTAKSFLAALRKDRKALNAQFRRSDVYANGMKAAYDTVIAALDATIKDPSKARKAFDE